VSAAGSVTSPGVLLLNASAAISPSHWLLLLRRHRFEPYQCTVTVRPEQSPLDLCRRLPYFIAIGYRDSGIFTIVDGSPELFYSRR
jgi:hypothetical protein